MELLRARWSQDIKGVIRNVDFSIDPRRFGPCGGSCFLVELGVTAEKKKTSGKSFFKQICDRRGGRTSSWTLRRGASSCATSS